MNSRKFSQAAISVSLLIAFLLPQKHAYAQNHKFVEIPLEAFHDQKPIELQGLISSQTLNIPIPEGWSLSDENWLEVQIKASPLLDAARSSMTIALNGLHVSSYQLGKLPETKQRILLPANLFTLGNNTLTFTGTLYLPNDQQTNCQNWGDPARWLAIQPGGVLHVSFARRDFPVDLSNFSQILVEPMEKYLPVEAIRQTLIVLPENSTRDDLSSLSTLSYVLGHYAGVNSEWHPEIVNENQFDTGLATGRNVVFIGSAPNEFQDQASRDKDYVAIYPSPWSVGNAVMVVGDQNSQDGFSPAAVFSDASRNLLLHGNIAYVDQQEPPARQPFPNTLSFEDLGYLDRTVRGIGQQSLIYSLYVPYDTEPLVVKLNLGLLHSPDLDIQNSSFTVYLNGFSIAGILPTARSSAGDPITLGLPAKRFRRGINFIRIAFDLHVPYSSCERALETIWATVLNTSTVEITYRDNVPIPSLEHFPLPFNDAPGSVFVIPDQHRPEDLAYVSRLAFTMGASAYEVGGAPQAMTAADFRQKEKDFPNVILVGLPSENLITQSANNLFPQPFTLQGNSLEEGYGVYLPTSSKDASLGLMEVFRSPWVTDGTVLVLTGNDRQGLEWTWDAVLNPALRGSFAGNVMVIGSAHRSQAAGEATVQSSPQFLFQQIADAGNIPIIGQILQRNGKAFLVPALVGVGIALLLVVGVLWTISWARDRKMLNGNASRDEDEDYER
jgi:hypothetical protein